MTLPGGAMIYQLPPTTYLNDSGYLRMQPYDHLKPYLAARGKLHWSYPALSNRQVRWQVSISRLPAAEMARTLAGQGFAALLIDKYGYADSGDSVRQQVQTVLKAKTVMVEDSRYVVLDLRGVGDNQGAPRSEVGLASESAATEGIKACPALAFSYTIDQLGSQNAPFSEPVHKISNSGEIVVRGWAVDVAHKSSGADLDVAIDGKMFSTIYGTERADVEQYFGVAGYRNSGFTAAIPTTRLNRGRHSMSVRLLSSDRTCVYESPAIPIQIE